jgi:hypothetical protein
MSSRFSRRTALKTFSILPGILGVAGMGGTWGCSGSADEEAAHEADAVAKGAEILARYKKFVVLVMENRSFDHYFGHLSLPLNEGGEGRADVNGFQSLAAHANPDLNNNKVVPFRSTNMAIGDIDHEWEACHKQFNAGRNDGFVRAHQEDLVRLNDKNDATKANCFGTKDDKGVARCGDPKDPMAFYGREETPVYHQLLDEYALCDNWFASVMGPTWPNRYYIHAATSGGKKVNKPLSGIGSEARNSIFGMVSAAKKGFKKEGAVDPDRACVDFFADVPLLPIMFPTGAGLGDGLDFINFLPNFNYAHLFDAPREGGLNDLSRLSGKIFGDKIPSGLLNFIAEARRSPTFETLCREGKLPPISFIEPPYQLAPMDDHPPHDVLAGQAFVASIYKMLSESPDWKHTCLIITYDEHGSFYDHVKPGVVNEDENAEFRQLGFRVPSLVIGGGIKSGHVSKTRYDHCSVLSTLTRRFDLEPSNRRVELASDIRDCIATGTGGSKGTMRLQKVQLSESRIMHSAEIADGQKQIVEKVFAGEVPFEAKRVFTDGMLQIFDRLGVANIGK